MTFAKYIQKEKEIDQDLKEVTNYALKGGKLLRKILDKADVNRIDRKEDQLLVYYSIGAISTFFKVDVSKWDKEIDGVRFSGIAKDTGIAYYTFTNNKFQNIVKKGFGEVNVPDEGWYHLKDAKIKKLYEPIEGYYSDLDLSLDTELLIALEPSRDS